MKVIVVETDQQLQDAYLIRKLVFVDEQQVPIEDEIDQYESESNHFVVYNEDEKPIGAGRFRLVDGYGKFERICILPAYRKSGVGKQLMETMIDFAHSKGFEKLKLNSQTHAIPFYEKLGFEVASDLFYDAGIPHKTMVMYLKN